MLLREKKRNEVCMGLQPLNRYLLGANWMYDRDIVFDLNEKMIHIYDNVQCVNNTDVMGQYTNKVENNTDLKFTVDTETQQQVKWSLNTSSITFILAMICLGLAGAVALAMWISSRNKNKLTMVQI